MNINDIKIPVPFQITLDDVGWIEGRTPYWDGFHPTRSGIPRRHALEDYKVINEIGKRVNMRLGAMFVIGDWDIKGRLSKVSNSTKQGKDWKGSPCIDIEEEEEIRDYINSAEYIDLAFHGLMHECWDDDGKRMGAEFLPPYDFKAGDKSKCAPAPEWYVREHLDGFMEIYSDWGFKKELQTFTCPGHCFDAWKDGSFTSIIKDYGVKYWQEPYVDITRVDNTVMLNKEVGFLGFWEAYDMNPDKLMTYTEETAGLICGHWPNLLRYDPALNMENIDKWEAFFNRTAKQFGVILSQGIDFAHKQLLYRNHCTLSEADGKIKIDFAKADEISMGLFDAPIYISVKNGVAPFQCEGGVMTEHSKFEGHTNYKIERNGKNNIYLKSLI